MNTSLSSATPRLLRESAGRSADDLHIQRIYIDTLVDQLQARGVHEVILDWDGCVIPVSGDLHGRFALRALNNCPSWKELSVPVTESDAKAAYEGDRASLQAMYARLGGRGSPDIAPHGVPWDRLMATNLVRIPLTAMGVPRSLQERVAAELVPNLERLLADVEVTHVLHSDRALLKLNPGTNDFLLECARRALPIHVVTMTPTALVTHFSRLLGVHCFISSYQGCEQFSADSFPLAKHDASLWRAAARRQGLSLRQCVIVEDSQRNIRSAIDSGPAAVVSLSLSGNQGFELRAGNHFACLLSGVWASLRETSTTVNLFDPGFAHQALPRLPSPLS